MIRYATKKTYSYPLLEAVRLGVQCRDSIACVLMIRENDDLDKNLNKEVHAIHWVREPSLHYINKRLKEIDKLKRILILRKQSNEYYDLYTYLKIHTRIFDNDYKILSQFFFVNQARQFVIDKAPS